jgi:hypothetical protein
MSSSGEHFRSRSDLHRWFAGRGKLGVELLDAPSRNVRGPKIDLLAAQILDRRNRRHGGPGDDDRRDATPRRVSEVDLLLTPGCNQLARDHDVAPTLEQRRNEIVVRNRYEHDVYSHVLVVESLVQVILEQAEGVGHETELLAPINEECGLRVRGQHANHAPFDHAVEIAGPFPEGKFK